MARWLFITFITLILLCGVLLIICNHKLHAQLKQIEYMQEQLDVATETINYDEAIIDNAKDKYPKQMEEIINSTE